MLPETRCKATTERRGKYRKARGRTSWLGVMINKSRGFEVLHLRVNKNNLQLHSRISRTVVFSEFVDADTLTSVTDKRVIASTHNWVNLDYHCDVLKAAGIIHK